jgi:hypothetical protein
MQPATQLGAGQLNVFSQLFIAVSGLSNSKGEQLLWQLFFRGFFFELGLWSPQEPDDQEHSQSESNCADYHTRDQSRFDSAILH